MNTCKNCKFWSQGNIDDNDQAFGECVWLECLPDLAGADRGLIALFRSEPDQAVPLRGGEFMTGPEYGCIPRLSD
jgi:hypothetical protein